MIRMLVEEFGRVIWRTKQIHLALSKVVQQWPIYYIDGNVTLNSKSITTITH